MYSLWVFNKDDKGIKDKIKLHEYEDLNTGAKDFIRFMGDYSHKIAHFVLRNGNKPVLWGNTKDGSIYLEKNGVRTPIEVRSLYKRVMQSERNISKQREYRKFLEMT